jgi:hypothetical protein
MKVSTGQLRFDKTPARYLYVFTRLASNSNHHQAAESIGKLFRETALPGRPPAQA